MFIKLAGIALASVTVSLADPLSGAVRCTGSSSGSPLSCTAGTQSLTIEKSNPWSLKSDWSDLRFEIRSGDVVPWDHANGHKAERVEISNVNAKEPMEQDIWFSFGMMVEPGDPVTSKWLVIGQLHASEDPGDISPSPAWAQELDANDQFRIVIRTSSQKPITNNPGAKVLWDSQSPGYSFERGRTYRFVYHMVYSQTAGRLETWRDGVKIVDYSGRLGFINNQGPWFKFGIYRDPATETLVVHYYDLQFGGSELQPE